MSAFIRAVCLALVRLFYPGVRVTGGERLPQRGPAIVVANHPNGLIDPVIVGLALKQKVHFLAKSTLFRSWLGKQTMQAFLAVPVYRAKEADTKQNEQTFALCRDIMQQHGWLALFPEGTSHSETHLLPLKTGAARIALQSEAASGFRLGVTIVPVGLTYDDKGVFRSQVTAAVGAPFTLAEFAGAYAADEIAAAKQLTERIHARLSEVVLEADDATLWRGFRFVARWIASKTPAHESDADIEALARRLAQTYKERVQEEPEEIAALVHDAKKLDRMLDTLGISDPFALDLRLSMRTVFWFGVVAAALAPIAAVGVLAAWLPYRLTGWLTPKLTKGETDLIGTVKALLGLVLIGGTYAVEAAAAGWLVAWPFGAGALFVLPFTGLVALRYFEWFSRRRALLGTWILRLNHGHLLAKVEAERAALYERIAQTLAAQ